MADKYLKLNTSTGNIEQQAATDASVGAGSAGKIIAANSSGTLDVSFLPAGIGLQTIDAAATEALSAGDAVNIYYNSTARSVRKANATDATKPANGFVIQSVANGSTATIYLGGKNANVAVGSFTTADIGKKVFLSTTAGGYTVTPPSTTGNLVQHLGVVVDVGSTVVVDYDEGLQIIV